MAANIRSRRVIPLSLAEKHQLLNLTVEAIQMDNVPKLLSLIPKGVDIMKMYQFCLGEANQTKIKMDASFLHLAVVCHANKCTKFLLHLGAPIHASETLLGDTALHIAAKSGNVQLVECILEYNPPINMGNVVGDTPLHIAASKGYLEICMKLVLEGALVRVYNRIGYSPRQLAILSAAPHAILCKDILENAERSADEE